MFFMSQQAVCRKSYRAKSDVVITPPDPPVDPPSLLLTRGAFGDSQTAGRATETNAENPINAFETMWADSGYESTTLTRQGVSGRSLANTMAYCLGRTFSRTPWIHMQESGSQNSDGQRTASEFGDTFENGIININNRWPGTVFSYETAYSFSDARKAQAFRNWDDYNTELRARVVNLQRQGITVTIVESEQYIEQLVAQIGYDVVCYADDIPNAYHYRGPGNFIIALAMYKSFGYDVMTLNHSNIAVNAAHKSAALAIVGA